MKAIRILVCAVVLATCVGCARDRQRTDRTLEQSSYLYEAQTDKSVVSIQAIKAKVGEADFECAARDAGVCLKNDRWRRFIFEGLEHDMRRAARDAFVVEQAREDIMSGDIVVYYIGWCSTCFLSISPRVYVYAVFAVDKSGNVVAKHRLYACETLLEATTSNQMRSPTGPDRGPWPEWMPRSPEGRAAKDGQP